MPVGGGRVRGRCVTGRDRGLDLVGAGLSAPERGFEQCARLVDAVAVPAAAVLLFERYEIAVLVDAAFAARFVEQHERQQPDHFGLVGHQGDERAPEPDRLTRERAAQQVGARTRRVALVEQEVQHCEHGRGALRQ